jgi:glucosamine-6-phosphate deaminase
MKLRVFENSGELGKAAALYSAEILKRAIAEKGKARLLLSTGTSQFDTLTALVETDVDWSRVEMFHLDEYIGLPDTHPASFRKYLRERFAGRVNLRHAYFVNGEGDVERNIAELSAEIRKEGIDLGLIGIGENAHVAFNDPPADFDTEDAYITVKLDEDCRKQQVREGWFPTVEAVPERAISMSVHQILRCRAIVSCVPYLVKAKAVKLTLENEVTNKIPATALKRHGDVVLFVDKESASLVDPKILASYR